MHCFIAERFVRIFIFCQFSPDFLSSDHCRVIAEIKFCNIDIYLKPVGIAMGKEMKHEHEDQDVWERKEGKLGVGKNERKLER